MSNKTKYTTQSPREKHVRDTWGEYLQVLDSFPCSIYRFVQETSSVYCLFTFFLPLSEEISLLSSLHIVHPDQRHTTEKHFAEQ